MWAILRRLLPLLLLTAGIASTIYGFGHHVIPVVQEQEETISLPTPFAPGLEPPLPEGAPGEPMPPGVPGMPFADGSMPGPDSPMGGPPIWQPPAALTKVTKTTITTTDELEPKVVFDVTRGRLTLADTGEIKRLFGDDGPSLCPS